MNNLFVPNIQNKGSAETLLDILAKSRKTVTFREGRYVRTKIQKDFVLLYFQGLSEDALVLLESYTSHYPNFHTRGLLFGLFCHFTNEIGDTYVAHKISLLFIKVTKILVDLGKSFFGIPPIVDDIHLLFRIGELVNQTTSVMSAQKLQLIDEKPILFIPEGTQYQLANSAFLPYIRDAFNYITDPQDIKYFTKMRCFSPYSTVLQQYSNDLWGAHDQTRNGVQKLLIENNQKPNFKKKK